MIKNIKSKLKISGCLIFAVFCISCSEYLDIVPDNTTIIEDFFLNRESAADALAKVYYYLPDFHDVNNTPYLLGDEWIDCLDDQLSNSEVHGIRFMRGQQNSQSPILNFWEGGNGGRPLYQAIRAAGIFLEHIDDVPDLSPRDKADWKAQVIFLKAYYHFLLLQHYGPIVIQDISVPIDATSNNLFQVRAKVEDCFDYIIQTIDKAIPDLKDRAGENDLGQVDKAVALAMKARIMLFRASPFFNGNKEFYGNFLDHDGQPFFPLKEDPTKWEDALDAVNKAITFCESAGIGLYHFKKVPYLQDAEDFEINRDAMQTLYDLRMLNIDSWTNEIIWGRTYTLTHSSTVQAGSNIRLPGRYTNGVYETTTYSWNWLGCTFAMMERYYTKNGLPVNEDLTFDKNTMYDLYITPGITDSEYDTLRGILQPGVQLIKLYLDREPRFYANLGITGGYWRSHQERIPTMMFGGTDGGYMPSISQRDWFWTGIGVQKFVHPESKSGNWTRQMKFPYPVIRIADLYLMKAEILNEIQGPGQPVWDEVNKIRRRAGIPDVEKVWSDPLLVGSDVINSHLDKSSMLNIILRERSIELAFEGLHFWDMHRYKRAVTEFNSPVLGWKGNEYGATLFFEIDTKQARRFLARDYLWPISLEELNTNANLIQNPGW